MLKILISVFYAKGCPFAFNVIDSSKVSVKGDGLGLVPCRVPTSVLIGCLDSKLKDYEVKVTGTVYVSVSD